MKKLKHWREYIPRKYPVYYHGRNKYVNAIFAFDTETTTFFRALGEWVTQDGAYENDEYSEMPKRALVYIWQLAIDNDVYYGRELSEFVEFWELICKFNSAAKIVYVHNLGYDFAFLAEYLPNDIEIFARKLYTPMYARIKSIATEFRCSYILTNMSLDQCAKQFKLDVQKKTGQLNYTTPRTPLTKLTPAELEYCEYDVLVIVAMIRDIFVPRYGCVANIPLTQTGEVRREVKKILTGKYYLADMQKLKPDLQQYRILTRVLQGGYTHLNPYYNGDILTGVRSFDRSSSYPAEICTKKFPMSPFRRVTFTGINSDQYAYLLHIRLSDIHARGVWAYIARHKVSVARNVTNDNGKIAAADLVEMWVTEIDYEIIVENYNIGNIEVLDCYRSVKKYLPKKLIEYVLQQYSGKTTLKGVEDSYTLYMRMKQMLNSVFGMMITNNITDEVVYINKEWGVERLTDESIKARLDEEKPFLSFAWGIWVTAGARAELWHFINRIGFDCIYCDTDSTKILNADKYQYLYDDYRAIIDERINKVCEYYDLDKSLYYPVDNRGNPHPLGYFEDEGEYSKFLSIGSKKYCYEQGGKYHAVVAGLVKSYTDDTGAHPTITDMSQFFVGSVIKNARSVHWHLTDQQPAVLTDNDGVEYTATNRGGIAIMKANYTFGVTSDYSDYILDVRNRYTDYFRFSD